MQFFPSPIPESVYLIYPSDPAHGQSPAQTPIAAAFAIDVSDPDSSSQSNLFLVTARQVVDPRWANCADQNPGSITLGLNRRIGGGGYESLLLQRNSMPTFLTSADPTVDLALVPLDASVIANLADYKFLKISSAELLTSSDLSLLRENLPVRTAEYATSFAQGQVLYPAGNSGSISEMRGDVTEVPCGEAGHSLRHLWFINADADAGLIGAPVFVDLERGAGGGSTRIVLGVQSDVRSQKGLIGITPAYLLGDMVRSALRRQALEHASRTIGSKAGDRSIKSRYELTHRDDACDKCSD